MKKLSIGLLFVFIVIGCSSKSQVVLKDTDYLKYGTRASVIEKVWGKADETMAFQDYRAQGYASFSGVGGSWNSGGGSVSGFGIGGTYIPTTIVWIYKEKGYALFFQQQDILGIPRHALSTLVWKLVAWEKLTTKPQVTPPFSGTTTIVTVTWTSANIRAGAGDEFPVLMTVNKGDKLTIIGESGEWFNVRLEDGKEGWINSRTVK